MVHYTKDFGLQKFVQSRSTVVFCLNLCSPMALNRWLKIKIEGVIHVLFLFLFLFIFVFRIS